MKYSILVIFLLSLISCNADKKEAAVPEKKKVEEVKEVSTPSISNGEYSEAVTSFSTFVCQCMESNEDNATFSSMMLKYNSCAKKYVQDAANVSKEVSAYLSGKGTDDNKFNLNANGNILMAKSCSYYRQTIGKTRKSFKEQMKTTKENVDDQIKTVSERLSSIESKEDVAQAHITLGLLYEFIGEKGKAMEVYEAGSKINAHNNLNPAYLEILRGE